MKITKLGHSCVLVEADGEAVLFDPGKWANQQLIESVQQVDQVVFTHEHADHFSTDILRVLAAKFPSLRVICNQQIAALISQAGITLPCSDSSDSVEPFTAPHEQLPIPGAQAPAQSGYHYKDVFTHPGDSQTFHETRKVLAMPFIGPWGKTGDSINKVLELKPKYVLPVHDWHYTDEAKHWLQGVLELSLSDHGITVLANDSGRAIEIK